MASADSVAVEAANPRKHTEPRRPSGFRSRALVIGALWTTAWWAIIGAIAAPALPGRWLPIMAAAIVAFAPMVLLVRHIGSGYASAFLRVWVLRPFLYLQFGAPLVAIAGAFGTIAGAPFGQAGLIGRVALASAALIVLTAAAAGYIGTRLLRVKTFDVDYPELPAGLDGLRIVQISDLHVGPQTPASHLTKIVRAVRDAKADLIAITGDQVDYAGDVGRFGETFGPLEAPLGVFAIPGNHDVYAGWPQVRAGLESAGLTVLVNDAVERTRGADRFWVAGTGDRAGTGHPLGRDVSAAPDIARTLARVPDGAFTIALAHNPALWPSLAARGVHLTLSGHTHHGQISIPFLGWSLASLFLEHAMGWYRRGHSRLYINPGTNYWGLPLRIGALPEVTIFTLRRG
jgi:predicted MPP superfamily phosphohydrolase